MPRRKPQEVEYDPDRKPNQFMGMVAEDWHTRNKVYDATVGFPRCNSLVMVGYVYSHPELEYFADGRRPLSKFKLRIPTPKSRRNSKQERDQYFWADTIVDVYIFTRGAENVSTWLTKGRMVLVDGELHTHYLNDKKGAPVLEKPIGHFLLASRVQFLDPPTRYKDGTIKPKSEVKFHK